MTRLVSISRGIGCVAAVLVLASACGGQSFNGTGGEAGSGATTQGGSNGTAGSHSTAGRAHGGSNGTAGSTSGGTEAGGTEAGGTEAGGSAGTGNEACDAPASNGMNCIAAFRRWRHDPTTGICMPILYGGCGATKNNYETLAACQQACPGGNPNYDACKAPSDCVIGGVGCCGVCDGPGLTAHDLIAYNKQYGIGTITCGGPVPVPVPGGAAGAAPPDTDVIACPACEMPAPGVGTLKNFVPNCVQGQCVVEDLRESAASTCKVNTDCKLRNGTSCCEACTANNLVAVRSDGSFEKLVCGGVLPPCLACVPNGSPNAFASCSPAGHCVVNYLMAGGVGTDTDTAP